MKLNKFVGPALATAFFGALPLTVYGQAYEVQELPVSDLSANQFASSIDNTGLVLTTLSNPFSPPIDLSLLDVDDFPTLIDPDGAAQGDFTTVDYTVLVNAFRGNAANFSNFGQKLANAVIYQTDGVDASYVNGFDIESETTDGFTFSVNQRAVGSANGAYIVGTSSDVFYPLTFTNDDGDEFTAVITDFIERGFVQFDNQVNPLMPVDDTLGGLSRANAVNTNLQVAGISSISPRESLLNAAEACDADDLTVPKAVCLYDLQARAQGQFNTRATIWQLDAQGAVVSTQAYPLHFEPAEEDSRNYTNEALDINNSGLAVGTGTVLVEDQFTTSAAMIFENGQTRRLIPEDERLPNLAVAVNDNNIVVGYQVQSINNQGRSKFFTYDLNTDTLTFPSDFFVSSSTIPRDINNNGIIVGEGEVEALQSTRRRAAFMYDIVNDTFTNLNDLTPCDSPYTIVSATSINESNEIVADATLLRPLRNVVGDPVLNSNGEEVLETTVVAVKLVPTGADAPDCSTENDDPIIRERQGASNSLFLLTLLAGMAFFRRKK